MWMPLLVSILVVACSAPSQVVDRDRCMAFEPDTAIAGCTAIIQSDKETPDHLAAAYFNRGLAYYNQRRYDVAIDDFDQAIQLQPNPAPGSGQAVTSAVTFDYRGNAYRHEGQYDRAVADFDEALRLNPDAAEIFDDRGVAYFGGHQYDRAIQDYDRAIGLASNFALAFYNRGMALRALGQQDRAAVDFTQARQLDPGLTPPPSLAPL
jgi:tetratricopeptide (TPR) repeat protein